MVTQHTGRRTGKKYYFGSKFQLFNAFLLVKKINDPSSSYCILVVLPLKHIILHSRKLHQLTYKVFVYCTLNPLEHVSHPFVGHRSFSASKSSRYPPQPPFGLSITTIRILKSATSISFPHHKRALYPQKIHPKKNCNCLAFF